ncbi:hypothetical protein ACIHEJ_25955 [Streptomyces sp. NPDC052301]|uniref:hypothetical protein n=1 Tax=Streptomyces sp. NPDC052301 TaxID=3365687 RepID=UPI0037D81F54
MRHPRPAPARTRSTARSLAVCLVAGLTSVAGTAVAHADTHVRCGTAALNAAIVKANAAGKGTIVLARHCVYDFKTPYTGQDATPAITVPITFVGNGAVLRRDPGSAAHFRLLDVAVGGTAVLRDLTVEKGDVTGDGGGILVQRGGTLRAKSVTVKDNTAAGDGGGIDDRGTVELKASRLAGNTAALFGGGLAVESGGTAAVTGTKIYDNGARSFFGGGVLNDGSVTIEDSSVTHNHVDAGDGGGLWNDSQMTVNGSTIADNAARDHGGGVTNAGGGKATFNGSTIKNNSAGRQAGGVYNVNPGSTLVLNLSRVTRNTAGGPPGGVFNGPGSTVVNKHSVIKDNIPTNCSPSVVPGCVG